jgi:hypothetical protein
MLVLLYGQGARNPDSSTGKVPVLLDEQGARTPKSKALQSGCLAVFYLSSEMLTTASGLLTQIGH